MISGMMRRWILGNVLFAVGLLWIGSYRALRHIYPLTWGGPNIGGGALLLLAYVCTATGLGLALSALNVFRSSRHDQPPSTRRRWSIGRWVPAAVTMLALVACTAVLIDPPGPGGSGIVGKTGVTVDANGNPAIVLVVCERSIDTLTFSGPSRGRVPNERLGSLDASRPMTGTVVLPLADLPPDWSGGPINLPLKERPTDLIIASGRGQQSELSQIAFTAAQLADLDPTQVLLAKGVTAPLKGISDRLCSDK